MGCRLGFLAGRETPGAKELEANRLRSLELAFHRTDFSRQSLQLLNHFPSLSRSVEADRSLRHRHRGVRDPPVLEDAVESMLNSIYTA